LTWCERFAILRDMDLRALRKRAGYTLVRLDEISGVNKSTICELERGLVANPYHRTIASLAAALEVTVAEVAAAIDASRQ